MGEEIGVGSRVMHRSNNGPVMVVIKKIDSEHGYLMYECRWYNEKSGSFECGEFDNLEVELQS